MEGKPKLYFCSECMHVYYNLPENRICAICHNEMVKEDYISDLQILGCETCHTLYTYQDNEKITPSDIDNKKFLCGCVHKCPTNSALSIGKQKAFIGNIVVVDIFKCSNCGAISYRNMENHEKLCSECRSRFISPLHWDPETQKTFFICTNPSHKIRLKLRDLILNNNQIIENELKIIKNKDQKLQISYREKQKAMEKKYTNQGFIKKFQNIRQTKKPIEIELKELNRWAKEERLKLYNNLQSLAVRCSVFRMDKVNGKRTFTNTNDGCGAIANLRFRKIVFAPDGTIIDRTPEKQNKRDSDSSIKEEATASEETIKHPVEKWTYTEPVSLINRENQSIFTQILHPSDKAEELNKKIDEIDKEESDEKNRVKSVFENLKPLEKNQIYIKIKLLSKNNKEKDFKISNIGVIPISIKNDLKQPIRIGRESLFNAYWNNAEFFKKNPYIFNNITPITDNSAQFSIEKIDENLNISPIKNSINQILYRNDDGKFNKLDKSYSVDSINELMLETYYAFDKEKTENDHNFRFIFNIEIWKNNEE